MYTPPVSEEWYLVWLFPIVPVDTLSRGEGHDQRKLRMGMGLGGTANLQAEIKGGRSGTL